MASLALDKLRQSNRKFDACYTDFQELMDILKTMDDTSWRHALKRGLNHEMLSARAIFPAPKDVSFDAYVECLNISKIQIHSLQGLGASGADRTLPNLLFTTEPPGDSQSMLEQTN